MLALHRLPALALVAAFVLPARLASAQDDEDTGCVMSPDSDLMQCLGDYASIPPLTATDAVVNEQAEYYCAAYSQLARCWSRGLYCREWLPMRIAADKFCAIANRTAPISVTAGVSLSSVLTSARTEGSSVISQIWHNDVGTDIPSVTQDLSYATDRTATWTHNPIESTASEEDGPEETMDSTVTAGPSISASTATSAATAISRDASLPEPSFGTNSATSPGGSSAQWTSVLAAAAASAALALSDAV